MNPVALAFLAINAVLLLALPRRWAPLPLLLASCYMTQAQGMDLGPFSFPFLRLVILAGFVRLLLRFELAGWCWNRLDTVMILWGLWALLASAWHRDPEATLINHLGLVYDYWGLYFLFRSFLRSLEELIQVAAISAILLTPVAAEMASEKLTGYNVFSLLGGVPPNPTIRHGHLRAQGPFRHAILAGTVGAVMFPWMVGLALYRKKVAFLGIAATLLMVFTCRSSGPVASLLAAILALALWRWRFHMRKIRWLAVLGYIFLEIIMKAPAYYLMARIDLAGGSTGWHRAALIESAIKHLDEWWWAGTDNTRHWMPTGVSWSPEHTDLTNDYIRMGVEGGLLLLLLFASLLGMALALVGAAVKARESETFPQKFLSWSIGASVFASAVTCVSVSYFDQSFLFLCLGLAATGALAPQGRESLAAGPTQAARPGARTFSSGGRPQRGAGGIGVGDLAKT